MVRRTPNVLVCSFYNPGRVNPILAITAELVQRGARVTCFGESSTKEPIMKTGAQYKDYFESLSSEMSSRGFEYPDDYLKEVRQSKGEDEGPYLWHLQDFLLYADHFLTEVKEIAPDIIFYDPALAEAVIASELFKIPRISLISTSGPGVFGDERFKRFAHTTWEEILNSELSHSIQESYKQRFGINPLDHGLPWQFYSPLANVSCVLEELSIPLSEVRDPFVYSRVGESLSITFVGPCINENCRMNGNFMPSVQIDECSEGKEDLEGQINIEPGFGILKDDPFPEDYLQACKQQGKRVIYFSLGTVIVGMLWNPSKDMRVGGATSGRAFFKRMVQNLVAAIENMKDVIVVLNIGVQSDAPLQLPSLPKGFIIRRRSPQVKALKLADVFITHGGAGSTSEALLAGVPTIVLPGFGDQLTNGETLSKANAGIMDWDPSNSYEEATAAKLKHSIHECLTNPMYRANAKKLGNKSKKYGGAARAANEILQMS